jgi:riboflavin kinase/FMN adenylyltransferase
MVFYHLPDREPVRELPRGLTAVLGFFDGVHLGHRELFAAAARFGAPILAWTFSAGGRTGLLTDDEERFGLLHEAGAEYLCAAGFDEIRDTDGESFVRDVLCSSLGVGRAVAGESFRFGKGAAWDSADFERLCREAGIPSAVVTTVTDGGVPVSSSLIRKLIASGDVEGAARLLGRDHFYELPVVRGKMLGRLLGFPTANQIIPKSLVTPARGVYVCRASFEEGGTGRRFPGVLNIGVCPTLSRDTIAAFREENPDYDLPDETIIGREVMETHVIGYEGDLYGKILRVGLCRKLRDEIKFGSVEELTDRIRADENSALEYFKDNKL